MWLAYVKACQDNVPDADSKMVFDRFHIMRHVADAVQGPKAGTKGVDAGGRYHADQEQLPVADQPGDYGRPGACLLRCDQGCRAQDQPSLGDQRGATGTEGLHLAGMGDEVLEALVFLGDTQPSAAHDRGRQVDCTSPVERPDLFHKSRYQRRRWRIESQNRHRLEACLLLLQSEQF